jgi:hypothetical protein
VPLTGNIIVSAVKPDRACPFKITALIGRPAGCLSHNETFVNEDPLGETNLPEILFRESCD